MKWILLIICFVVILGIFLWYVSDMTKIIKQDQDDFNNAKYMMPMLTSKELWDALSQAIKALSPENTIELNKGASKEDFKKLEDLIGTTLPDDFKQLYAWHNGQKNFQLPFYYTEELLSIDRIIEEWSVWKQLLDDKHFEDDDGTPFTSEPQPNIKNNWWNPKWIPITYDGNGNHLCLDLDPANGVIVGQIIRMWHDDSERSVEAFSIEDLLNKYLIELKSGHLFYSDDYGGIVEKWEE